MLLSAVREGRLDEVKRLIDFYGLPSSDQPGGYDLLCEAVKENRTQVVELLLTHGYDVNGKTSKPANTPLHFATSNGNLSIVKMLLNGGADVNAKNQYGKPPLFYTFYIASDSFKEATLEIIKLLLNYGANVNDRDSNNSSSLHAAIWPEYFHQWKLPYAVLNKAAEWDLKIIVNLLLSRGAYVNIKDENDLTPLHIAARNRYTCIVEDLLNHGASINSSTFMEGYTPLHCAIEGGNTETVKLLLSKGADINFSSNSNLTPLHIAVIRTHTTIIKLLLKKGAKVDSQHGKSVLHLAVETRNLSIVEDILEYQPDVNNQSNRRSLKAAVCGKRKEKIYQALVEYGFKVELEDTNSSEFLHATVKNGYLKIVEDLLKYGADVNMLHNSVSELGFTPLHCAAKNKQEEIAKLLISYKADVNAKDEYGKTPIFYAVNNTDLNVTKLLLANKATVKDNPDLLNIAVRKECLQLIEMLLQHDIDINDSDQCGRTALHCTVMEENECNIHSISKSSRKELSRRSSNESSNVKGEIAKLLLEKGAKVDCQTKTGLTPLCAALRKGFIEVVKVLLDYNANVNCREESNITPLHVSIGRGNYKFIAMLLTKGANVNAKQKNGITPLHIAVEENDDAIVELLLEHGANVDAKDKNKVTPLHLGTKKGYFVIVKILLKFDADANSRDDYGKTALHIACECGRNNIVDFLLKSGSDVNIVCKKDLTPLDYVQPTHYPLRHHISITLALKLHIQKMKIANLYLNEKNLLFTSQIRNNTILQNEYKQEVTLLRSEKIEHANISYYDVLVGDVHFLLKYMRNDKIVQVLKSVDYISKFPIYGNMIKSNFRNVMKRKNLLKQVNEIIYFLFNNLPVLPGICIEKICSYIGNEDLRNIVEAYKST